MPNRQLIIIFLSGSMSIYLGCLFCVVLLFVADVEEFLTKKAELNDLQLKRQHQLYVSSGQLPVMQQVQCLLVA